MLTLCQRKNQTSQYTKVSQNQPAKNPGERVFIDISSMIHPSTGGKKNWLLIGIKAQIIHTAFS